MQAFKACTTELSLMGKPMDDEDIAAKVIKGLHYDTYKPVIDAVRARDTPISFEALHEKLLNHELTIKHSTTATPMPASVHAAAVRRYSPNRNTSPTPSPGLLPTPPATSSTLTPNPFKGKCQWCRIVGHVIGQCHKFKKLYPNVVFPTHTTHHVPSYTPQAHTASATIANSPASWLIDSGATHHITNDLSNLALHSPYDGNDELIIGDGSSLPISHIGSFSISLSSASLNFSNVLYVPSISRNVLSVSQFCHDNDALVEFTNSCFLIKDKSKGTILLQGKLNRGIYEWHVKFPPTYYGVATSSLTWHHRLGHPSLNILKILRNKFSLDYSPSLFSHCNSCEINKSHKLPFSISSLTSIAPLELIYSDVWTAPIHSHDNYKYYVIFVDHFTKYIWFYPLKAKSDTTLVFNRFRTIVEKHFKRPILHLYSDNGGEYIKLTSSLLKDGIIHLTSPPHTPEHNGYAERRHRHIVETGLSLLSHAHLPSFFWSNAFVTAAYLINRLPTPSLNHDSPFFTLFKTSPNYQKLKSFGCLCYPWLRPYTQNKLDNRSSPCVFIGYSSTQSAYHCLDPTTNKIYTSRHVKFVENVFPYMSLVQQTSGTTIDTDHWCDIPLPVIQPTPLGTTFIPPASTSITPPTPNIPYTSPSQHVTPSPCIHPTSPTPSSSINSTPTPSHATTVHPPSSPPFPSSPPPPPPPPPPLTRNITTRLNNNIVKPNPKYTDPKFAKTATLSSSDTLPTTATQALLDTRWRSAMNDEFQALQRNGTWTLVSSESAQNVVGCKWVFRIKYHPNGTIEKYKARLVAKGFHQRPGLDYSETFSPVVKPSTIRLILSLVVSHGWPIRQLDVNNAFLQGTLHESVYMAQPPGFVDPTYPNHVCKHVKAIYGLKQAPRAWYTELKNFLLSTGFKSSIADPSLFFQRHVTTPIYVLVYVDDIIVTSSSTTTLSNFITHISNRFSLKDLGSLSYFLGIEVRPSPTGLLLTQTKYIHDLLSRYKMLDANPTPTPMSTDLILTKVGNSPLASPTDYRTIVGSLQYLSLTRPDIAFVVNKLAQFMSNPHDTHWSALKRLLRYLKGTMHHGIAIHNQSPMTLHSFCDADWAGDKTDYLSTTGYIVYLGRNPISWSSKKQRTIARSSTEAEFRAVADTTAEVIWVQNILAELQVPFCEPPIIYCDNLSATHYSANPVFHSRMKHLALAFHFVRELVQNKMLRVQHISGDDQLADALTKPLPRVRFQLLLSKIGLSVGSSILRGGVSNTI
ncbi:hypothetical protein vseg_015702 [Gypsophila vaccaria]